MIMYGSTKITKTTRPATMRQIIFGSETWSAVKRRLRPESRFAGGAIVSKAGAVTAMIRPPSWA
ncbi:hypothetical protein D3C79_1105420 [compost metagenome]